MSLPHRLIRRSLLAFAGLASLPSFAAAQCPEEPVLQYWTGAGSTVCPCFVAGEEAGVTFTAPAQHYPLEVLRVQIGWGSVFGGSPDSLEAAIHLYPAGLPNPGTAQFSLPGPVLTDGFLNEFDLSFAPGNKIINSGPFTLSLEFLNNSPALGPSVVHDGNGCQGGKNVVDAIPGGWNDACVLGVSGDWLFGVIYRPVNCCGDQAYWALYGNGYAGTIGIPTIAASNDPEFGAGVTVSVSNSKGSFTVGLLLSGFAALNTPGAWGGDLLVNPTWITLVPILGGGTNLSTTIPDDPSLCGLSLYAQMLESDPGAPMGLSSTQGLELHIGE